MIKTLTDPKVFEEVSGGYMCQCGYTDPRDRVDITYSKQESLQPCKEICCGGTYLPGMYLWYIEDGVKSSCPRSDNTDSSRFRKMADAARLSVASRTK